MTLRLDPDDLSEAGRAKMETDFQTVERRDGGKTSRFDFALGWMACAAHFGIWQVFSDAARARLRGRRL